MKKLLLLLLITLFLLKQSVNANTLKETSNSIVKVHSSLSIPNYKEPWQTSSRSQISGSGAIIENNYIITNAHVVSNAKFIQVSKDQSSKRVTAKIKYISHQADLAILEVDDKHFFDDTKQLQFTQKVKTGDNVTVLGYPMGGETLSTTKGTISRIEQQNYVWSYERMLAIQIDASVNSGNSGGAAFNDNGKIVGIIMQSYSKSQADNISYIIPSMIVNTFLEDIKDDKVDGFDDSKIFNQTLTNKTLRSYYNIKDDIGILITKVEDSEDTLKAGDIILEIENYAISNDGKIQTAYGAQFVKYLTDSKPVGYKLKKTILRDGKKLKIEYTLKRKEDLIQYEYNQEPRYLIFGGFSFTPLTKNYLNSHKLRSGIFDVYYAENKETKHAKEPVVIQVEKFNHNINEGYYPYIWLVKSINGHLVVDFKHLVKLLDENKDKYTVIDFWDASYKIILNTKEARESFAEIKNIYGLSSDRRVNSK
jgi:S1-C subfamily serine protease